VWLEEGGTINRSEPGGVEPDLEILGIDMLDHWIADGADEDHPHTRRVALLVVSEEILDPCPLQPFDPCRQTETGDGLDQTIHPGKAETVLGDPPGRDHADGYGLPV